ncbi:ROK family protein [Acaryochloris sp. CCMEE 5410]|uniref:ROK family protein n=1 Tax=Acaryochloris sp. CCMEE 5410 TaxID=310037 RepID=UPI00024839F3|nr:ROK family protein [Acaryochloris sp. CCMEE 5410]KAI9134622.1 ROK family protein [Acaryochloris sp. CCMEE 5410]
MADNLVLGIDLGGTAIKLGCCSPQGTCVRSITVPTPQPSTPEPVVDAIATAVHTLDPDKTLPVIGIGMPGPADNTGRIARVSINLDDWLDVPLAEWIEDKTGRPTTIANDANCAGLGEALYGAGQSFQNLIMLTLGTGVGGAIIMNGELYTGRDGAAGELGLITLWPDGPPCNSGNNGSLEQFSSVRAIRRDHQCEPHELAVREDETAIAFWQDYGRNLGAGLASLIYVLTPEAVILGGGIAASTELFLPWVQAEIERRVMPTSRENLVILPAALGNQAGMIGAAQLARQRFGY